MTQEFKMGIYLIIPIWKYPDRRNQHEETGDLVMDRGALNLNMCGVTSQQYSYIEKRIYFYYYQGSEFLCM